MSKFETLLLLSPELPAEGRESLLSTLVGIIEREENKCIKFATEQSPIDANLWIQVLPVSTGGSKMRLTLKADLNMMMKMMIGKKLESGIDQFADMLASLPY